MAGHGNSAGLLKILAWMSPAFPVGAFSYSGGLESAVADGRIKTADNLEAWIALSLGRGTLWNDAVLLAVAFRSAADKDGLATVSALALALAGSAERYRETLLLGQAFVEAARQWPHPVFDTLPAEPAYPVAVGSIAGAHEVGLSDILLAYCHAAASQFVSAGIRLGVIGQRDGVGLLVALEDDIAQACDRALTATLDDLGSATIIADTASMRHETLGTRLFRS